MNPARLIFDIAGAVALLFGGLMVVIRHPIKSLLAIVVSFFALAVAFVLLSAPFLAALQVIVYAGAILVLFLFVTMLLNLDREEPPAETHPFQKWLSLPGIVLLAIIMFAAIGSSGSTVGDSGLPPSTGEVAPLAQALFSRAALPFEAVSVLLLSALVGAYVLARREEKK